MSILSPNLTPKDRSAILFVEPNNLSSECVADALRRALPDFRLTQIDSPVAADRRHNDDVGLIILGGSIVRDIVELPENIRHINQTFPAIPIAILGTFVTDYHADWLAEHGVKGIFPEVTSAGTTMAGLRFILQGGEYFPRNINALNDINGTSSNLLNTTKEKKDGQDGPANEFIGDAELFTRKEAFVLSCLSAGQPNKVIAKQLDMAENTVKIHIRSIFKKLRVSNRTEAVLAAQRLNLSGL
jgi:two-component system, NarL family, nitrate/nitrite response regulator NarL